MTILSAAMLLFLILDPLGNIPVFLSVLKPLPPRRQRIVVVRELLIALAVLMLFLRSRPQILATPYRAGIAFGVITYFIMNWLVVPLRFGTPLPPKALSIATQLFAHVVLVGIPMSLVAARAMRPRS